MAKILKRPKVWRPLQACRSAIFETVLGQQKRVEFLDLPIGQRSGLGLALRLPQQQQTSIGRLLAAVKIYCEFLASNTWKVEGKQRIVGHGGCGAWLIHGAICLDNDLLRESLALRYSRH
jgi:hypothetical protein